jgi:hypothetical protein
MLCARSPTTLYVALSRGFVDIGKALAPSGAATYNAARMKPPSGPPSRVADVLGNVLKRVDPDQQMHAYTIWTFWDDEVGDGIARRAQPTRFRNGILFVTVATHSWLQELQFMKEEIRSRLNARLEANLVRDIFFVVGHIATAPAPPNAATGTRSAREPVVLPPIDDLELAAAMARVVAARARHLTRQAGAMPPSHTRTKKPR